MKVNKVSNEFGSVNYSKNVLLDTISLATKEVEGVAQLADTVGSSLKKLFSKNYCKGVRLEKVKGRLNIDVYISVYHGYNVTDMSCNVQQAIKRGVDALKEYEIGNINVNVVDVIFK
jgi:uncharacterized alkaline shock family protein YloU